MSSELALIEIKNPLEVFSTPKGLDAVIDKIEAEVKNIDRDISTEEGRNNIRSIAFKLAKSKTALDKMGKDLTENQRKQIELVNTERKRAWERMEVLQHEIRQPLTDWENAEKDRVALHESALSYINDLGIFEGEPTTAQIFERIKRFTALAPRKWDEFEARYTYTVKTLSDGLAARLEASQKRDAEAAELERLRREEAERKQKEHEARIAAEATKAAEEKATKEAEAERIRTEKAIQDAKDVAEKAERDRMAAIAKAESDRKAAEEKAKRDSEAAVIRERERVEAAKKAEDAETAKREADTAHRKKINNEALNAINAVLDASKSDMARGIVEAIAKGQIPHVKIIY